MKHKPFKYRVLHILTITLLFALGTLGQDFRREDGSINYSILRQKLLKKLFPDIQLKSDTEFSGTATKSPPFRPLFAGVEYKEFSGETEVSFETEEETVSGRETIIWMIVSTTKKDDWSCRECQRKILAAFRLLKNDVALIDAADVKTGDQTDFIYDDWKIRGNQAAVVVLNSDDSSQRPDTFSFINIKNNALNVIINQFDIQGDYTENGWCEENAQINLLKTSSGGYRNIEIIIQTKGGPVEGERFRTEKVQLFRYIFGWQPREQRYKPLVNPEKQRRALLKRFKSGKG